MGTNNSQLVQISRSTLTEQEPITATPSIVLFTSTHFKDFRTKLIGVNGLIMISESPCEMIEAEVLII